MKKTALVCTAVLGVLSLSAEPSAAELVARAQKGPSLLFTQERLPEIRSRIAHDPDAVAWWRTFRVHAEKEYVRRPVDIPDRGAQWYHYYSCRKCGRPLKSKSPTLHVCPACGETHTGWPYDDAALFAKQNRAADAALDCALVYALDGSPAFAATARAYLTGLASAYPGYLPHDNKGPGPLDLSKRKRPRCGRAFPQALDESVWLIKLIQAYDCLGEALTAEERAAVKEKLFRPAADLIKRDGFGIHNHECWHLAAYGMAGLVLGDVQWVSDAIDSPIGVKMQLEKGILSDRCWFEGAWGYHFYTMNALAPFLTALSNLGYPPPIRFKDMFDAPLGQVTPTWQLPAVNDTGRVSFRPGSYGDLYELAWTWWRDPAHAWWLSDTPRATRAYALQGTPLPKTCEPPVLASVNYADSGMAILRGRTPGARGVVPDNYVAIDYGPHGGGHGHPDKLNLILWGRGEMIAEDPGCIAYGNPRHWEWYRATLAHNTLVMDGLNQKHATGRCLSFTSGDEATMAVFEAGEAYPDARVRRAVALAGDVVLDVMLADAEADHRWEWAFHARHAVTTSVALADCPLPAPVVKPRKGYGPESDGASAWNWTTDVREGPFAGTWNATWRKPDGSPTLGVVQAVRDGVTREPVSGVLRTAVASAQPPPQTFSLAVPHVSGRKVMFAGVLLPGRTAASACIEEAVWKPDGTARLVTVVDGRRHAFTVKPDGTSTYAAGADMIALPDGGPVTFHKMTAGSDCVYRFTEPGTYARDVTVVPPAKGPMWYAFESRATSTNGTPVVNEGRIIVPTMKGGYCARIANVGSAPFIQKGAIETGSRLDVNGNVTLACPFRFSGTGEALFNDDAVGRIQVADGFSFGGEDGLAASFVRLLVPGVLGKWQSLVAVSESRETINEIVRRLPPAWRARSKVSRNGHRLVVRNVTAAAAPSLEVVRKVPDGLPPSRAVVGADGTATLQVAAATPIAQIRDAVRAARVAHPGRPLIVSLAEGVYPVTETVTLSLVDSGTPSAPITWRGEGRGAVFAGAAALGPWRGESGRAAARPSRGPWRAAVPKESDGKPMWAAEFFVNGERRANAAYPAGGRFTHATNITEKVLAEKFAKHDHSVPAEHTLFLRAEDFAHVAAIPEAELPFVQVRIHSKWNAARHFIVRIDRAACSVTIRGTRWPPWNRYIAAECPIRFENVRTELTVPGEWFYDCAAGEIVYLPKDGDTMDRVEGTIPVDGVDVFLRLVGDINAEEYAGNIRFENIAFRHGSTLGKKGPADVPDSLMLGAVARGMVLADGVRNVVFDGCRWEQTGGAYGVWFREGCMSNAVVNCVFRDLGGGAVRVGVNGGIRAVKGLADELEVAGPYPHPFRAYVPHSTAFITVENCLVERGGRYMPGAGAIVVAAASDCRVVHNRIDDLHYTAITCNWDFGYGGSPCQRCLVAFNHISNVGHGDLSDMGGVYMAGSGFGNVVARNVIHGVKGMVYGGWGLYPDEGTEGVLYESNLVYDTKDGGIHQHFGRDNVVRNNIFAFAREGQVAITRAEPHRSWTFEGNIVVWDQGDAFAKYRGTKDEKAIVDWKRNLWWRPDGRPDVFNGKTFAEWQAKGKDVDGLSTDPLFVDAAHRDFRFRDTAVAAKIGFKPFDFSRAGLCDRKVEPIYDTSYERKDAK